MRCITRGRSTPREQIRDEIIPFHLDFYGRCDQFGTWAAEAGSTGDFLGWFHFRPGPRQSADLGYWLRRAAWNLGYATEGSRALIHKSFTDLGVQWVFAHAMAANAASRRVMEKSGLTLARLSPYAGSDAIDGSARGKWNTN